MLRGYSRRVPASATVDYPTPVLPDYGGACLSGLVPALLGRHQSSTPWLPEAARTASQVVLLVLDGLGWDQLTDHWRLAPNLAALSGGPITSVTPTTTATALTSVTTGLVPAAHGVVGYRVRVVGDQVMNVLKWCTAAGDAREAVPPTDFQPRHAFGGTGASAVTRSEFAKTGFTTAHLGGAKLRGWRMASTLAVEVGRALRAGEPLVYAYYDGMDKVAHEWGLAEHYDAELVATDRLIGDVLAALPAGAALVVTSDHGQVSVGDAAVVVAPEIMADVSMLSGEGRFRWLHARPGALDRLVERACAAYQDVAWVVTRQEMVADGWFGGPLTPRVEERLGDVALVPHAPIAFDDPADTGEMRLVSRHGSLTGAEMRIPLLAWQA